MSFDFSKLKKKGKSKSKDKAKPEFDSKSKLDTGPSKKFKKQFGMMK